MWGLKRFPPDSPPGESPGNFGRGYPTDERAAFRTPPTLRFAYELRFPC